MFINRPILLLQIIVFAASSLNAWMYLRIPTIPGESQEPGHKDWIDILSVSSDMRVSVDYINGIAETSRAQFGDIKITKRVDKSSPLLMLATASGNTLHGLTLEFTRYSGMGEIKYFEYVLRDVIVTSISSSGSKMELIEDISLNYSRADWQYWEYDMEGNSGSQAEAWWDIQMNIGGGSTSSSSNLTPTIEYIPNQTMQPGESRALDVIISDDGPVDSVNVSVSTKNPDLIKYLNIKGTGSTRTLSFTTSTLYSGLAGITVVANDGQDKRILSFTALIGVEATPFETFMAAYFSPAELDDHLISSPLEDPDKDGIVTLVEYALVTNPREYTYPEEAVQIRRENRLGDNFIVINFRRRTDDPNVGPKPWMAPESMKFSSLKNNPAYEENSTLGDSPLYEDVEGSINIGDGALDKHFLRMQVEYQQ